jgi:hypothetical protein
VTLSTRSFIYGVQLGAATILVGKTTAAAICFLLGRTLLKDAVTSMVKSNKAFRFGSSQESPLTRMCRCRAGDNRMLTALTCPCSEMQEVLRGVECIRLAARPRRQTLPGSILHVQLRLLCHQCLLSRLHARHLPRVLPHGRSEHLHGQHGQEHRGCFQRSEFRRMSDDISCLGRAMLILSFSLLESKGIRRQSVGASPTA